MAKKKVSSNATGHDDANSGMPKKVYGGPETQLTPAQINALVYHLDNRTDLTYIGLTYDLAVTTNSPAQAFAAGSKAEQTLVSTDPSGNRINPVYGVSLLLVKDGANMTDSENINANKFEVRARVDQVGSPTAESIFTNVRPLEWSLRNDYAWIHFGPTEIADRITNNFISLTFRGWNGRNINNQVLIKRAVVYFWRS